MRTRGRGRGESACRHDEENKTDLLCRDTALFCGWVEELDAALENNVRAIQETFPTNLTFPSAFILRLNLALIMISASRHDYLEYPPQHARIQCRSSGCVYDLLPFRQLPSLAVSRSLKFHWSLSFFFPFLVSLVQYARQLNIFEVVTLLRPGLCELNAQLGCMHGSLVSYAMG